MWMVLIQLLRNLTLQISSLRITVVLSLSKEKIHLSWILISTIVKLNGAETYMYLVTMQELRVPHSLQAMLTMAVQFI